MNKRVLGRTGISVSEIAFGGVEIGMPYGIGVEDTKDMLSELDAINLLHSALDSGINFFDTARMYGNSEMLIGKAFKNKRAEVVICTKCRHLRDVQGNLPKKSKLEEFIQQSLYESLKFLKTEYVDVFMLHQVDNEILENDEIANVFLKLKKDGKIRATGISTYTPEETEKAVNLGYWDVIQLPFNLLDQRQGQLFNAALDKGVGIVVRSVLLKGLLSDRGKNLHPALKSVEDHIVKYEEFIKDTEYNLPEFATKFALSFPEVSSVLVGIDKQAYLEQSLKAANGNYLTQNELKKARQLSYPDSAFLNLSYWSKMNWLK